MQLQDCFTAVDRTFRDLLKVDQLFGEIPVLLGGDFTQIPPVVPNASIAATVLASIRNWIMWPHLTQLHLTENMRLRGVTSQLNRTDAAYLLRLSHDPTLYGATSLPPYVKVYDDYAEFYSTPLPSWSHGHGT